MERNPDIETKINEALESFKKLERVEAPPFFTDKTMQKLHSANRGASFSYSGLLKIAAVVVLLAINVYTIQYILNTKQDNVANTTVTVKDVINEYQPNDGTELTFEENLQNER
jgi:hypothetical protein